VTLSQSSPVRVSSQSDAPHRHDDGARPLLHIHPERGWLNDPNGLCRIDGTYHVFFQYNPAEPVHGGICWGHVSSTDLLRWNREPVALAPRPDRPDRDGCWSGCIVDDGGVPTAVYTAVSDTPNDAGVVLARSDRSLRNWVADDAPRIGTPDDPAISQVRDPFVFGYRGHRYAVQGAGHEHGSPQLLLYGCDDLERWTFLGPLLTADDPIAAGVAPANIWECPNLFRLGESWVLIISLWRSAEGGHELSGVRYLIGELVEEAGGLRFETTSGGTVDSGPTFYAPQVLVEPDRVLLWGWAWEGADRGMDRVIAAGWAGTLTSPRELVLVDGGLVSRPAAELTGLRREALAYEPGSVVRTDAFEVGSLHGLRLRLVDEVTGEQQVVAKADGPARLLVDGSLVELFGQRRSFTSRAYPGGNRRWVVDTAGPAEFWRLGLDD
jgi:beta-fructofuranosidase